MPRQWLQLINAKVSNVYCVCLAQQQQQLDADMSGDSVVVAGRQLDAIDRACILTAVVLVASCFVVAIILSKCTSHWHFTAGMYVSMLFDVTTNFGHVILLRDAVLSVVYAVVVCLYVCVCLSVTLRYCIKMAKRRITQIMSHESPRNLVF